MSKLFKPFYDVLIDDVLGSTEWHGDTNSDNNSFDNMKQVEMVLDVLLSKVHANANLADNAQATASGAKLQKQAELILKNIKELIL